MITKTMATARKPSKAGLYFIDFPPVRTYFRSYNFDLIVTIILLWLRRRLRFRQFSPIPDHLFNPGLQ